MNKLLITSFIILTALGCDVKKEATSKQSENRKVKDGELLIFSDSLKIKLADKLTFIESYEGQLLFHAERYGIVLTDFSGNVISDFNPVGGAENEVGGKIKQMCFSNSGQIAIASDRGVSLFSSQGKFLSRMNKKFPYNSINKDLLNFIVEDQEYFISGAFIPTFHMNMTEREYYESYYSKMIHNLDIEESTYGFNFPDHSIFKEYIEYYLDLGINITLSDEHKTICTVFNPDKRVYLYDFSNEPTIIGEIDLIPPDFKRPFTRSFEDGRPEIELIHQSIKCNSKMMNMSALGDFVYIEYRPGLPADQSDVPFEVANDSYKKYILKVDLVNKKHVASYKLPDEVFHLQGSFNDQLVFSSKTEGYDYETFYLIDAP